mmetsp:Transcript_33938/g.37499  ORF Transcript_33938/g.37499 Transcript_33938/m.37499 type:complete len:214 (+) Transcript_33938:2260-2901(+)
MPPSGPLPVLIRLLKYSFSSRSSIFFNETCFRDLSEESPKSSGEGGAGSLSLKKFARISSPPVTDSNSIPNSATESSGPASLLTSSSETTPKLLWIIICIRTSRRKRCGRAESARAKGEFSMTHSPTVFSFLSAPDLVAFFFFTFKTASSLVVSAVEAVFTLTSSGSSGLGHASTVRKASSTVTCSSFPTRRTSKVPIRPDFPRRSTISSSIV